MKLLIFWDVYWRIWRNALIDNIPLLKEKYSPDFIIANTDNLSSGRWPIEKHILELEKAWVDIFTSWDHLFDNYDKIKDYLNKKDSKLLRLENLYNENTEWEWVKIFEKNWKRLLVINLLWQVFISHNVNNPFSCVKKILNDYKKEKLDWIIIDFHREATSEIYWMFKYIDWEVSLIYWTHTHVQTNDDYISKAWTWIITDVGMVWPFDSVIWADFESVKDRFLYWINKWKIIQSISKPYVISWIYVEIDNMECKKIEKIRIINN